MPEQLNEPVPDSTQTPHKISFEQRNIIVVSGLPEIYIELEIPDFDRKATVGKYYVKKKTAFECEPYMGDSVGKYEWGMEDWGAKISDAGGEFEPDNRFSLEDDQDYADEEGSGIYGKCILTDTEEGFRAYQSKLQYLIPATQESTEDSGTSTAGGEGASGQEEDVGGNEHVFKLYINKQKVLIYRDSDKKKLIIPDGEQPAGTEVEVFSVVFLDNQDSPEESARNEAIKPAKDANGDEDTFSDPDQGFKIVSCVNRVVIAHKGTEIDDDEPENYAMFMDKLKFNDKGEIDGDTSG